MSTLQPWPDDTDYEADPSANYPDDEFLDELERDYRIAKANREAEGQLGAAISRVRKYLNAANRAMMGDEPGAPPPSLSFAPNVFELIALQRVLEAAESEHSRNFGGHAQAITDEEILTVWRETAGTFAKRLDQLAGDNTINGRRGSGQLQLRRRLEKLGITSQGMRDAPVPTMPLRVCSYCRDQFQPRDKHDRICSKHPESKYRGV